MFVLPIIEQLNTAETVENLLSGTQALQKASQSILLAQNIEQYLLAKKPSEEQFERYSDAVIQLLNENHRLALYLPMEELRLDIAPANLRAAYNRAWRKCWNDIETRGDYTQGDISPARNSKEGQKIIKAFHLLPWLIRGGMIQPIEIDEIIERYHDNTAAMQSLSDCVPVFENKEFFGNNSLGHCSAKRISEISALRPPQPKGFDERAEDEEDQWRSRGHASLSNIAKVPDPNVMHICFNTIWVGTNREHLLKARSECAKSYFSLTSDSPERHQALRALENDLLKYHLLHKGFPYYYDELSPESARFCDIDGNSAFYNRRYRSVATCLFAKYIHNPQI